MRRKIPAKPITQMNAKELGHATKEFEREFVADSGTRGGRCSKSTISPYDDFFQSG